MDLRVSSLRSLVAIAATILVAACTGTTTTGDTGAPSDASDISNLDARDAIDAPSTGDTGDSNATCANDTACDDGIFCNGAERCTPGASGADSRGCVAAAMPACVGAGQTCDEAGQRCRTMCIDADGDGHGASSCGGDDCDDTDPNRFPGRPETCDSTDHDEDCDATTFGFRDGDADGFGDIRCCNVASDGMRMCGNDCNDAAPTAHPSAPETCDGLDNDCNGMIDEGARHTYYLDADGDGFGSVTDTTGMQSCFAPANYAENHTDCNDSDMTIHPGAVEICDANVPAVDENCDGMANPTTLCMCTGTATRPCMTALGVCAAGTETCVSGAWSSCSIAPTTEVCNDVDDDCDGATDEGLRVTCYPDGDNDGYPSGGSTASPQCPQAGRESVGGCPTSWTNREPLGTAIDCNDSNSAINPSATEICIDRSPTPVDENCNGMIDEGVAVICYVDNDGDTYAPMGATPASRCIDSSRASVGGCPFGTTNRAPTSASAIDCDDMHNVAHPGGTEVCDPGMLDEDCDGMRNPSCACVNGATQSCPIPGACAAGTQMCTAGAWGACSVSPTPETCNGIDDDCDGVIDDGVQTTCYTDGDADGYAPSGASSQQVCGACPLGSTARVPGTGTTDCNDMRANTYPSAPELCDALDNDCSSGGGTDSSEDADGDGHAPTTSTCSGGTLPHDDCYDTVANVHPGQGSYFTSPVCAPGTPFCSLCGGCMTSTACFLASTRGCGATTPANFWDYNCNGGNDLDPRRFNPSCSSLSCVPVPGCAAGSGYTGITSSTQCGTAQSFQTCGCASGSVCVSSPATSMVIACH